MKGYVLEHGTLTMDQRIILGDYVDETGVIKLPVWTMLLEHPDGLILIDTGMNIYDLPVINTDFWNINNPCYQEKWEANLLQRLLRLGHNPEDISHVIISHLHSDHDGYIHHFPNANVWVSDAEFTGLMRTYGMGVCRPDLISKIEFWAHEKIRWNLVTQEVFQLVPGVTLHQYGMGHHYGMLCTQIDFKNYGSVFLASDAIYTAYNAGPPVSVPGRVKSFDGYIQTVNSIQAYCASNSIELWYGHDQEFFDKKMIKFPNGYYE